MTFFDISASWATRCPTEVVEAQTADIFMQIILFLQIDIFCYNLD